MLSLSARSRPAARFSWILFAAALVSIAGAGVRARAQDVRPGDEKPELPGFERTTPSGVERPSLIELPEVPAFEPPGRRPGTVLPPLPAPTEHGTEALEGGAAVTIREVRVLGVTALPESVIEEVVLPYLDRPLGFEDLQQLRDDLIRAYVERGFVTSGVVVPSQSLADGVLELRAIEGWVTAIEVETDGRLRPGYVERRLGLATGPPVDVNALERALQLLQQDEKIRSVAAELVPGEQRGEAMLKVRVTEAPPFRARLAGNNYSAPAIGSGRGEMRASWSNVTGFGDALRAEYKAGVGLQDVRARWEAPLTAWDTALDVHFRRTWSEVVEDPFVDLGIDIESQTETYGFQLTQPLFRTENTNVEAFAVGEWRRSESLLFDESYSFVPGPDDGVAKISVLRFGANATWRSRNHVVAARTLFTKGFPWLGATRNDESGVPDAKFFAWLGQVQWAGRFPDLLGLQVVARVDVQLADSPLFALEQFAIGGHSTVRGYRENRLVRDNGVVGSVELRIPVPMPGWREWRPTFELAPFFDVGRSWNTDREEFGPKTLMSVGVGGRLGVWEGVDFQVYWGHDLKDLDEVGSDLQDDGVHLGVVWSLP